MPQVLRINGYTVYFWSNEYQTNLILEPVHFHVSKKPASNATKFWITSYGKVIQEGPNTSRVPKVIIKSIIEQIEANPDIITVQWLNFFKQIRFIDEQR